jgi:hypothetical protein
MNRVRGINPRNELRFMVPPAVELESFIPPFLSFQASKVETSLISRAGLRPLGATLEKFVFDVHAAIPSSWNRSRMPRRRVS